MPKRGTRPLSLQDLISEIYFHSEARERTAFQIEGNYVTGIWLCEEAESQNRKEIFRSFLIRFGLQKTFRTDGQELKLHVISFCLSCHGQWNYCFKNIIYQKYILIVKIWKMLKNITKKIKITYKSITQTQSLFTFWLNPA